MRNTYTQVNDPDDPNGPVFLARPADKVDDPEQTGWALVAHGTYLSLSQGLVTLWVGGSLDGTKETYPRRNRRRAYDDAVLGFWSTGGTEAAPLAPTFRIRRNLVLPERDPA